MKPTPRTDAMRLKMAQLGWPSDGEPVAMLMASHAEIERELSSRTNPHRGSDFNEFLIEQGITNANQPMTPTPTPRTDALVPTQGQRQTRHEYILALEEHARQLERELADKSESLAFQTQLNREVIEREKRTNADLLAEREQVAILRSDERRLSEFAKAYRLRADEADDKLAAERALADRLAESIDRLSPWLGESSPIGQALAAWKEARSGSH